MPAYRLLFSKNNVLIALMVLIPTLGMGILLLLLMQLPDHTPDWLIVALSCCALGGLSLGLVFVMTKKVTIPCEVTLSEQGISYRFQHRSWLYRRQQFSAAWDQVVLIDENNDNGQGTWYRIRFRNPTFTINLSAAKDGELEAADFFWELACAFDRHHGDNP